MDGNLDQVVKGNGNIQAAGNVIIRMPAEGARNRIQAGVFYSLAVASLFATTLPHPTLNIAAATSAVIFWGLWAWASRRLVRPVIISLAAFSILSGCVPPLIIYLPPPQEFACTQSAAIAPGSTEDRESPAEQPIIVKSWKVGQAYGVGVFGFGLDDVHLDAAKRNGGINKVAASQEIRGYGLISIAQVRVYGE